MKQIQFIIAALLCVVTSFAKAETASLGEIVITATRMPQALNKTIADTTILNEQEIRDSGAPDVPTIVRSLAGVEVSQSGGLGAQSGTYIRGSNSNQVLVLIDGVRINSATTGSTALEHIMLDNVERIEVVRGNVSSLYGSEAIGGVIQIFTKHGSGAPAFTASAGGGTQGTKRYAAGFSGTVDSTSISLNASKAKTDGVSAINSHLAQNVNPNNNGYDNNTLNAQIKHAFNADHVVNATWFSTRSNASFDTSGSYASPTDLNNTLENIDKFSLASDDQVSQMWHSQVHWSQGNDDSHTYTNDVLAYRSQTQNNQFAWQNNFKIADGQQLSVSAEHLGQIVTSDTPYTQTTRIVNSVLGGYTGDYDNNQVQLNLRQDNYSDFGVANTGLLGYGVGFAGNWRATASVSTAFKAPTFNDMFAPSSWGGNPNLKPERSQDEEIGLHYASSVHRMDVVYFDNRISDLIIYQYPLMMNINQAEITGQELSYTGDYGNKHLKVNVTFQNPRDSSTGALLPRRAKEFASIAASHDLGEWNLGTEARYSGERQDKNYTPFPPVAVTLPSYSILHLTARYNIDKHLNVSARVDNVFNSDYSEIYGYNTLGRTLFVGVSYH